MSKSKGPRVKVTLRLPPHLARVLRTVAAETGISLNDLIVEALNAHR